MPFSWEAGGQGNGKKDFWILTIVWLIAFIPIGIIVLQTWKGIFIPIIIGILCLIVFLIYKKLYE